MVLLFIHLKMWDKSWDSMLQTKDNNQYSKSIMTLSIKFLNIHNQ